MPAITRRRSASLRLSAGSPLLRLPEGVLRLVLGWSPDAATAQRLTNTCWSLRNLRRDPAAMALLLIHCQSGNPAAAFITSSFACEGGQAAVVHQVLQLLRASPDCGGPYSAPPPLLQAMLNVSAIAGDTGSVREILDSPTPPDINSAGGQALRLALHSGPHMATVQALLERGADPCLVSGLIFFRAGGDLQSFAALPLLLQHCPAPARGDAIQTALSNAIVHENTVIVDYLLPLMDDAGADFLYSAGTAALQGKPRVLHRLLDFRCSAEILKELMDRAASQVHASCVTVLLDRGALLEPLHSPSPLALAIYASTQAGVSAKQAQATAKLLLRRGAQVTPAMLTLAAGQAGNAILLAMLRRAAPAVAPPAGP